MVRVEHIAKSFGGLMAVFDVSLDLGATPITGLVGPNGSGKTTLFHIITGFYPPDRGGSFLEKPGSAGFSPMS